MSLGDKERTRTTDNDAVVWRQCHTVLTNDGQPCDNLLHSSDSQMSQVAGHAAVNVDSYPSYPSNAISYFGLGKKGKTSIFTGPCVLKSPVQKDVL